MATSISRKELTGLCGRANTRAVFEQEFGLFLPGLDFQTPSAIAVRRTRGTGALASPTQHRGRRWQVRITYGCLAWRSRAASPVGHRSTTSINTPTAAPPSSVCAKALRRCMTRRASHAQESSRPAFLHPQRRARLPGARDRILHADATSVFAALHKRSPHAAPARPLVFRERGVSIHRLPG